MLNNDFSKPKSMEPLKLMARQITKIQITENLILVLKKTN